MKILLTKCPNCKQEIYSRANHDCKSCECGDTYVDGGHYDEEDQTWVPSRTGAKDFGKVVGRVVELNVTYFDLYTDWNYSEGKYGIFTSNELNEE